MQMFSLHSNYKGMRIILLLVTFLGFTFTTFAQNGKIEGKVTDSKTGQPLSGVSIIDVSTKKGTASNIDGTYSIVINGQPKVSLQYSYNGVTQQVDEIEIKPNVLTIQDVVLTQREKTEDAVVVRSISTARKETAASLITFQKNTNTVASVISAESIRRSPDKNTGEVLKRTPGASLVDGKFLVIRGLADRYNQAMLNGILLTSTEPDRKTFSFDIIPSQIIDNIVINKAFVPELPGEFAGGLIQVNTKDIPGKNFFNIQIGTGFNSQTVSNDFFKAKGGKTDFLGIDDGNRSLPANYTGKAAFNLATQAQRNEVGKSLNNNWIANKTNVTPNASLQINGGFNGKIFGKKVGGILGISYNKSNKFVDRKNTYQDLNDGIFSKSYDYNDDRFTEEISLGSLASFTLQLNPKNKISLKSIVNVNTNNYVTKRDGVNIVTGQDVVGGEIVFKQNTFFTTQITGDHSILPNVKFKWYGAFNILDGYSPDQKRYQYTRNTGTQDPYLLLIGNSLAQESGSRTFQTLSDYIYTGGGDVSYTYNLFGNKQTVKAGYMLQIKDRLFDAQLFANFLPRDNPALRQLPIDQIFNASNFGNGTDTSRMFSFNSINNRNFRYIANTILNAGFVQFDNQFGKKIRVVYGLRVEDYDQLLGSVKKFDSRFLNTKKTDFLPGINATYKLNPKTNIRLSGSQTVNRGEQRELSPFTLFDFELNASVQGNPNLERTKITNIDLRYELYPNAGEAITIGTFYKEFKKPIEQNLQQGGAIFQYANADKANVIGAEAEIRKKLNGIEALKNFTFQANIAYVYSKIKDTKNTTDRPLQGQSPYLLNVGLLYDLEKQGVNATLLFNQIGKRIYIVGDLAVGGNGTVANIWEKERPVLDFQISKKILKNKSELRLNVSDIINQTQIFYQNNDSKTSYNKNSDVIRFSRKFGTTYSLSFNYSL